MTCVNCKYQWCWLCEGEYKYGHYEAGKCRGQQFVKADYPSENNINNQNVNQNNHRIDRYATNGECNFGLHRIFRCVYPERILPFYYLDTDVGVLYLLTVLFWIFGVYAKFIYLSEFNRNKNFVKPQTCSEKIRVTIAFLTGFCLWVSFQFTFMCLITPFILICLIYPKFFVVFIAFLGIGEP